MTDGQRGCPVPGLVAEIERLRKALHRVAWTAPHGSDAYNIAFEAMAATPRMEPEP